MGQGIGAAQVGAAGSPVPDPAPCPDGAAEPCARPVLPPVAVLGVAQSPSSFALCCKGPRFIPGEMAQAGIGGTWEQKVARWHRLWHSVRGGSGKGVGPLPCATGRAGVTTPCPAATGTCRACAWPCPGHGSAPRTPVPVGCLRPISPGSAPRLSPCHWEHPLPGHRQRGHAVTPQRPCPAVGEDRRAAREAPQRPTVPPSPGTLTSPWGEAGEAVCRSLSLGAGVLLAAPS